MKDLIHVPQNDHGLQLMSPMDQAPPPPPPAKFKLHKLLFALRKYWWILLTTLVLSLAVGFVIFLRTPPIFVSYGSLWETVKLALPGGAAFTDDRDNYLGTQT